MKSINPNGSRINLSPDDSPRDIRALAGDPRVQVIQFNQTLPLRLFEAWNELLAIRPDIENRVYGFYTETCDLSFCRMLPNAQRFRADCLQRSVNVEQITAMRNLNLLGIGIWDIDSFDFLHGVPDAISDLTLLKTKSKKPDLSALPRFAGLANLTLSGQQKGIEAMQGHPTIQNLRLLCIKIRSLELLRTLPSLAKLEIGLGGTLDLSELAGIESIKHLWIWRIAKLQDVSVISTMVGLQYLEIEDQPHITELPSLNKLTKLRKIRLSCLKALTDVSTLVDAPALEELNHYGAKTNPEDYLPLLRKGMLKMVSVYFNSKEKDEKFKKLCADFGIVFGGKYSFHFL